MQMRSMKLLTCSWSVIIAVLVAYVFHSQEQTKIQAQVVATADPVEDQHERIDHHHDDADDDSSWSCSSDLACNLNGLCLPTITTTATNNNDNNNITHAHHTTLASPHHCVCDQGWTGVNCSQLDLIPTASNSGYRPIDRSSWGASIWYDSDNNDTAADDDDDGSSGRYYMLAAEMIEHCGLTSWRTHSKTILATSSSDLSGPYEYHSTIVGIWTHNPVVVQLAATATNRSSYLLYAAGYGDGQTSTPLPCYPSGCCTAGTSPCGVNAMHGCNQTSPPWPHPPPPDPDNYRDPDMSYRNISVWHADRLLGPWRQHWAMFAPDGLTSHQYTPTAWTFPNGTVVVLLVGGGLFHADTWMGPYRYWGAGKNLYWGCTGTGEDPFLYVDARGHWHCLYHAAPYANLSMAGGHAYSVDGTAWYATPNVVYRGDYIVELHNSTIHNHNDNGTIHHQQHHHQQEERKLILGKRERPHLVFDKQQNILALVTGVCVSSSPNNHNNYSWADMDEQERWSLCNNNPWPGYYDKTFTHVQRVRQKQQPKQQRSRPTTETLLQPQQHQQQQ